MRHTLTGLIALLLLLTLTACGEGGKDNAKSNAQGGKPVVYVTNYPLLYFTQRIAGDLAEVRLPEIDGDPAFWKPGDAEVEAIQGADLILMNGATYEKWALTHSLPASKTVDTSAGFADRFIEVKSATTHSHGTAGEHSHAGTAFTTWLDMDQARQQAEAVRDALIKVLPDHEQTLRDNTDALVADINELDEQFMVYSSAIGDQPIIASHPVYQYLARRYRLNLKAVLWEPETVPSEADLDQLKAILKDHPAKWMIWEGKPAKESVALLDAMGIRSVVFDPAGNRPDKGDWLSVMNRNVEQLRQISADQNRGG